MAVMVTIDYQQIPPADYDAMQPEMEPEFRAATGFVLHTAVVDHGRLSVVEIWDSRADFETWMTETIIPVLARAGGSEPDYSVQELHNLVVVDRE